MLDSNYDSTPVSALKQQMLAGIQFPLNPGPTPTPTTASTHTVTPKPTSTPKPTATPSPKERQLRPQAQLVHRSAPRRRCHTPLRTATPSPVPTTTAGLQCQVVYKLDSDWGTGFEAEVAITNTGSTPINGWQVSWTWPGNQQMTQSWNATYVQTGNSVTLTNMSYNPTIAARATESGVGFLGAYTGSNPAPTVFYLNGKRCN